MSFVTTDPEALTVAANNLAAIGSSMAAENSAAAAPTTGVVPAAADPVSALQATQFAAYGTLYQQVSSQAKAIYDLFVHTMRVSADSYGATEAANSVAAAPAAGAGLAGTGPASTGLGSAGLASAGLAGSTAADPSFGLGGVASNAAILATMNGANIGSATSEFTGLGKGYITAPSGVTAHTGGIFGTSQSTLVGETAPAAPAPVAAAPVAPPPAAAAPVSPGSPGMGQAPPMQSATPPAWAGEAAPVAGSTAETTAGAGWTAAAPEPAAATAMPAGMPAVASADRGGSGFGRPRYGVKPKVTPRSEGV